MTVGAHAVAIEVLPKVHGAILVPEDRLSRLLAGSGQLGQGTRPGVEMLHGLHGNGNPGHPADSGAPDPRAEEDRLGFDAAPVADHCLHPAAAGLDGADSGAGHEERAPAPRLPGQGLQDADALAQAVGRDVVPAVDSPCIDVGNEGSDLFRGQDPRRQSPGTGQSDTSLQVPVPLPAAGDFDASHRMEAGTFRSGTQFAVELHGPLGQLADGPGRIGLEDQPGSM